MNSCQVKYIFPLIYLLFLQNITYSQEIRGLYVNRFYTIITNKQKSDKLLSYAKKHNFNYLLLYSTGTINDKYFKLNDSLASLPLAKFIHKAKTQFGIKQVGAIRESADVFKQLIAFNKIYKNNPLNRFDVFNLEFEFWNKKVVKKSYCTTLKNNNYNCNTKNAFKYYIKNLKAISLLCKQKNLVSETYIGHPTKSQSKELAKYVDRILVHYYWQKDVFNDMTSIYNYKKNRLFDLSLNKHITVLPIFSATHASMFKWLLKNKLDKPFHTFMKGKHGFNHERNKLKKRVHIAGYQWFTYSDLQKVENIKN